MEVQSLPSSFSRQKARPSEKYRSTNVDAVAARVCPPGVAASSSRWCEASPYNVRSRGVGSTYGCKSCWRQRCRSTGSRDKLPLPVKSFGMTRSFPGYTALLIRAHISLALFFLCALLTLQQLQMIHGAKDVTPQLLQDGSEGITTRGKQRHTGAGKPTRESKDGVAAPSSEVRKARRNTIAVSERSMNDGPASSSRHRPRSVISTVAPAMFERSGKSNAAMGYRVRNSSESSEDEENISATSPSKSRQGVWVPATEEDLLSSQEMNLDNTEISPFPQEREDGEMFELDIDGQPLLTQESNDALSFPDGDEEGAERPSQLYYPVLRRGYSGTENDSFSPSNKTPDLFFTAKESLFETLYKKAALHKQEDGTVEQEGHHDPQQESEQYQQSLAALERQITSNVQEQRSGHLERLKDKGTPFFVFDKEALLKLQTTPEVNLLSTTPQNAVLTTVKATSATGKDNTYGFAVPPLVEGSAAEPHDIPSSKPEILRVPGEAGDTTKPVPVTDHAVTSSTPRKQRLPPPLVIVPLAGSPSVGALRVPGEAGDTTKPVPVADHAVTSSTPRKQSRPPPLIIVPLAGSPSAGALGQLKRWHMQTPDFLLPRQPATPDTKSFQKRKDSEQEEEAQEAATETAHKQQQQPEGGVKKPEEGEDQGLKATGTASVSLGEVPVSEQGVESEKQQPHPHTQSQASEKDEVRMEKEEEQTKQRVKKEPDVPTTFAARRMAERWEPCGRWTNFIFIFVNPASGDGTGAHWISRTDSTGHYQTEFKDICTRVHLYNLRHGEGGAPDGFQLLRRLAAAKHVLSVAGAAEVRTSALWKRGRSPLGAARALHRPGIPNTANGYGRSAGASAITQRGGDASARHGAIPRPQTLVRAIAVGGDGTVSWVNRAASEVGVHPDWLAVGVVGFGTGNDFAQSYGWASIDYSANIFKAEVLKQHVLQWQAAQVVPHDVWRVNLKTTPNGYFEHVDSSTRTFKKILCEKTGRPSTILSGYMTLYFGIGFEALLGLTFDMSRSTSRLRNRMLYGLAFFKHLSKPWRLATDQIESVYVFEGGQKKVLFTTNPVKYSLSYRLQLVASLSNVIAAAAISMTFIGTETILGGVKVWENSRRVGVSPPFMYNSHLRKKFQTFVHRLRTVKQDMGDKKLEIISFRSRFSLMRSVMYEQNAASRLVQHQGPFYVKFYPAKVSGPVPFQVDGEFFLSHHLAGAEIKYARAFYVLKQHSTRHGGLRVMDLIDALGAKEKDSSGHN